MKKKKLMYVEIAIQLKNDILAGKYPMGSYIPTERELEETFNVSKITVRNAVEILANEGYVEKKSGKGTIVISNRLFNKLSKAASFSSILEENHQLEKELIGIEIVPTDPNSKLRHTFGDEVTCLRRMYYLDGKPYITFEHYFPVMMIKNAINEIEQDSLYKWLDQKGYDVAKFQDKFYVVTKAKEYITKILATADTPLLCRERTTVDADGDVVEISYGYYDSTTMPYIIEYEI
ncbi:GntR family transcriptional regulator [Erysipelothrix sp. HDW6C]|uniref:GntR family transcriptional regulator n=1 Tax=Erysipelothrix sp. HDW6C TaxID=2714930 RepID=UPI001408641C|nr:GntR family transcriptional regulator [Erysipelothrix sp. HDW6C]QIK70013.1 GntR family transcriptional regulator [Erysipelothrix sp. HDW6C]